MTADRPSGGLGPLGRRLLAAFVLVSLTAVLVLAAAALVGAERGLSASQDSARRRAAEQTAAAAAAAYVSAGGWSGADLQAARAVAIAAGARQVVVTDVNGEVVGVSSGTGMMGGGMHMGGTAVVGGGGVGHAVVAGGRAVGAVRLAFGSSGSPGRDVAWSWIAAAAVAAVVVAVAVSWFVTRRLTEPLVRLTATARAFAAGDRSARAGVVAPGELGELARAFDATADEVARSESARRHLSGDVAHELRTPLAALQAGLEELRDGLVEPDPTRLAALHDQSLRLGRIVNDLAELSAAEAAALSLHVEPLDLAALAADELAAHQAQLHGAGIQVESDLTGPVWVRGDADRLHQAVGNLLANVARHCRPGDRAVVAVSSSSGTAELRVSDTGPGIPPDELPRVFDRMWRGSPADGDGGSGIGLAVVRELVAAHGGTVSATSDVGSGTTFRVRLPLEERGIRSTSELLGDVGS